MKKISLLLFILLAVISCSKDDTTIPKVTISETTSKVIKGQSFSVDYSIEENDLKSASLTLLDGKNTVLDSTTVNSSGTFTFTLQEDVLPPLVLKVSAEDNSGNIGVGSTVLDILSLEVDFLVKYNGVNIEYLSDYEYLNGNPIEFSKIGFFLSDLKLDNELVKDVTYIDIPTASSDTENPGYHLVTTNVKPGNYTNISFNFGVPATTNATKPSDYTSDNPLSLASEYWSNWESYIFSRIEGNIDNDENFDLEQPFALHTGGDEALMEFSFNQSIQLDESQNGKISFVLDLKEVFEDNGNVFDLPNNPMLHAPAKKSVMLDLARRIEKHLKVVQ